MTAGEHDGTWGAGNFASDYAADWLADLTRRLLDEARGYMADRELLEWDEVGGVNVPCSLELLALLAGQRWVGVALPEVDEAEGWKQAFMEVWDASIDGLAPSESSHRVERRAVLVATFDGIIDLAGAR